ALIYDDCRNLLDYRFLRNFEEVEIGKSLEFDSVLVEICDTIAKESCFPDINTERRQIQIIKVVEATKKLGLHVNQSEVDMKDANSKEWHVVYTKQKKQKMKKYIDGILKLLVLGAWKRQVILSTEDGKILEKRYLNCQEDVKSNCRLEFEEYLVEVGEPKVCQTVSESCVTSSNEIISTFDGCPSIESKAGNAMTLISKDVSSRCPKDLENNTFRKDIIERSNIGPDHKKHKDGEKVHIEPIRTVNQILTILKKPIISKDNIYDAPVFNPVLRCSTSLTIEESFFPNILNETSKQGVRSEYPFKESVSKDDGNEEGGSLKAGQGIHSEKPPSQGSSMESVKSLLIPTTNSLKYSRRHFIAPAVEINASVQHLVFPETNAVQKFRQVLIPNKFASLASYRHIMSSVVYNEINLM
ncbi:hypothetical protein KI387_031738, partial [Taxus chinensis]